MLTVVCTIVLGRKGAEPEVSTSQWVHEPFLFLGEDESIAGTNDSLYGNSFFFFGGGGLGGKEEDEMILILHFV